MLGDRRLFCLIRGVLCPGSPFCGRCPLNYLGCLCFGGKDDLLCLSLRFPGGLVGKSLGLYEKAADFQTRGRVRVSVTDSRCELSVEILRVDYR